MKKLFFILMVLVSFSVYAQSPAETPSVYFTPYSADLRDVSTEMAISNFQTFAQVARLLADNPQYRVLVDGHANAVLGTTTEEREMLRPLSRQRAEAAAEFLAAYFNIGWHRLIVSGAGGNYPLSGLDGSLNRRVSFTVVRP